MLKNWYPVSEWRNKYCLPEIWTNIFIYCFYIDINTLLQSNLQNSSMSIMPHLLETTQVARFPSANSTNNLEPVLTSFMPLTINKTFIFQLQTRFSTTSNVNFANIFIFSESLSTKNHFGDIFSKIHPLLKEIEIAPGNDHITSKFISQ